MNFVYLFNTSGACISRTSGIPDDRAETLAEMAGAANFLIDERELPIEKVVLVDGAIEIREPIKSADTQWAEVRATRTSLLFDSDWTDLLSARERLGEELYASWQSYRQALRVITEQADPFNITWPTPPQ
jgi:hypothetical protein